MRWLMALLIFAHHLHATVLVQAPTSATLDYRGALKANPEFSSPTQELLKRRPQAVHRDKLLTIFAEAQQAFLANSKELAKAKFESLAALFTADDWAKTDRQIFLNTFLRLAQLEIESSKQQIWLSQAVLVGDDVEPETGLYPPPLLTNYFRLKTGAPRALIDERWWRDGWTAIMFNGVVCTRQTCAGLPLVADKVRVTWLSDTWLSYSDVLAPTDFAHAKPRKVAWVAGECGDSQLSAQAESFKKVDVFWSLECQPQSAPPETVNLQPTAVQDELPRLIVKVEERPFYKSKWFWAGVGVVGVAALILANSKKDSESTEPSTTYGVGH